MTIVCVYDEGPGIGLGHRRRVEALAAALHARGDAVEVRVLDTRPVAATVVVVDSYRVRADDRERFPAEHVVAIDDIERDLAVDLVVDPDPGADARVHTRAKRAVAGAEYAFVSPALQSCAAVPIGDTVRRVLVTTGAADAAGHGPRVARALAAALPGVVIRQVAGPWGAAADDPRVDVVHAPDGLGAELAAADLVCTAGGVTMLEACCLGRPTVAFAIVPGQDRSIAGLAALDAVVAAGVDDAARVAAALATDNAARRRLSTTASRVIDGQGATRAATLVAGIAAQGVQPC